MTSIPPLNIDELIDWRDWILKEQWELSADNEWHRPYVVNDMKISDEVLYQLYLRDKNKQI